MKLIVDTNIVISSIIRDAGTRKLLFDFRLELSAPEHLFEELYEHEREIEKKAGISEEDFERFIKSIKIVVKEIPSKNYASFLSKALKLNNDAEDASFIAAAISMNANIWTNDKDFLEKEDVLLKETGIKIMTTKKLMERLEASQ